MKVLCRLLLYPNLPLAKLADFLLQLEGAVAIVPLPERQLSSAARPDGSRAPASAWVRGTLIGLALVVSAVLFTATRLDPYEPDGTPRTLETHTQLGLPPCTFRVVTGVPCPACGMTTSFALLMKGDIGSSLRANAVGSLLAACCVVFIPWAIASSARGRLLGVASIELALIILTASFLTLLILRWLIVVGMGWLVK